MAKIEVDKYSVEWSLPKNKGRIYANTGGLNPVEVDLSSFEEFMAVMLLLSKAPVFFDTNTREFEVGPRPVGS